MTTHIEVLQNSTLKGNVLTLPAQQLDRKLYQETAKALEGIGGKWNKKALGFVFPNDPTELLEEIKTGVKRNIKQETQFFETCSFFPLANVQCLEVMVTIRPLGFKHSHIL